MKSGRSVEKGQKEETGQGCPVFFDLAQGLLPPGVRRVSVNAEQVEFSYICYSGEKIKGGYPMYHYIISWNEFRKMQQQNRVVLVDVRSREAFKRGHIPYAVSIPFEDNPSFMSQIPRRGILVISCYRGNLSARVTGLLRQNGFTAYSLAGGYEGYLQMTGQKGGK